MSFRDQALADLPTFVNVDEFGEIVSIDGDEFRVVFDGDGARVHSAEGVIDIDTVIYVRASDFYKQLVVGQQILVDDEPANVVGVDEQHGMLVIRLRWLDS